MTSEQKKAIDACKDQAAIDWALSLPAHRADVLHSDEIERFEQIEKLRRVQKITHGDYAEVWHRAMQLYGEQCRKELSDAAVELVNYIESIHDKEDLHDLYVLTERIKKLTAQA